MLSPQIQPEAGLIVELVAAWASLPAQFKSWPKVQGDRIKL